MKDGSGVYITFKVKSNTSAGIGLFPKKLRKDGKPEDNTGPIYAFIIGAFGNYKSIINRVH